jgi:hypothetical protein
VFQEEQVFCGIVSAARGL